MLTILLVTIMHGCCIVLLQVMLHASCLVFCFFFCVVQLCMWVCTRPHPVASCRTCVRVPVQLPSAQKNIYTRRMHMCIRLVVACIHLLHLCVRPMRKCTRRMPACLSLTHICISVATYGHVHAYSYLRWTHI